VTDDHVARLRRLDTCAVSDALDRLKLGHVVTGIPRQSGEGPVAGRVVTVKLGVGDPPPGPPRHLSTTAVESAGPDHVIVVEQRSGIEAAAWGGLLSLGAKLRGIAAAICDGPVRDIDESRAYGFPVFARKLTAITARGRIVEFGTDVPIVFEGVRVDPGDYAIADSSAIVLIPAAEIARVLETAEAIAAKEAAMAEALKRGEPISTVMGASYEHMLAKN
jgi:4-hydroxy-4-methyl-2-oxoglutarate aldolase